MSKAPTKANDFLRAMGTDLVEPPATVSSAPRLVPKVADSPELKPRAPSRSGLKHIGGYFDRETVEKVAVLRARLDLDNSELIKRAIDELHRRETAKRSFGEA